VRRQFYSTLLCIPDSHFDVTTSKIYDFSVDLHYNSDTRWKLSSGEIKVYLLSDMCSRQRTKCLDSSNCGGQWTAYARILHSESPSLRGEEIKTLFTFTAASWTDENIPLSFVFISGTETPLIYISAIFGWNDDELFGRVSGHSRVADAESLGTVTSNFKQKQRKVWYQGIH
jgi:hypothetical protein